MQMKKEVYSQPVSEIYELKLLGSVLLNESNYGSSRSAGQGFSSANGNITDYTDGDDF